MAENIYTKLSKVREAVRAEKCSNSEDVMRAIAKKAKALKVLPLFYYYEGIATLTLVNMEDITDRIEFKVQVDSAFSLSEIKYRLYYAAFDLDEEYGKPMTAKQYIELTERMDKQGVQESEILERYKLNSITDMTVDIFKRCMSALNKTKRQQP